MVWFTFTFLLGIPINTDETTPEQLKKNEKFEKGKNYTEKDVSKPYFSCHIEYILIPNQPSKFIDVVCWDHAAKIYFESSTTAIMPHIIEKIGWIHFRINHKLKLAAEDIPIFHKHTVKFSVKLGAKTLGEAAKADKPKKFYGLKFSNSQDYLIKKELFQPLSETLEELHSVSFFKEHLTANQRLHISLDNTMETSEHFKELYKVLLELSDEYHDENFIRIPTVSYQEIPPLINVLRPELDKVTIDVKDEKRKTSDLKRRDIMNEQIEFSITGEDFLSGRRTFENCLKYKTEELPYIFCLGEVKDLLNRIQTKIFNPLSITLSHIKYLPTDELQRCGINKIKFQYLIFNEFLTESNLIPINNNNIKLNYARTILTHSIDNNQLIHFIQTAGLKINILGKIEDDQVEKKKIYSRDLFNNRLYTLQSLKNSDNKKNDEFILLGTAYIDISSILFQPHRVLVKSNLKMPISDCILGNSAISKYLTTLNEFNFSNRKIHGLNCCQCIDMTSSVITVLAKIRNPIIIIYHKVLMNPNLFNRLFLVIYDINLAFRIVQILQEDFPLVLDPMDQIKNGLNIKRPLCKRSLGKNPSCSYSNKHQITGFLIDCIDKILIFVESSVFGNIQKIWAVASSIHHTKGRVLYDSSLVFLDRLYGNFLKIGGVLTVILKDFLEVALSKTKAYGSGNIPVPALNALTRLHLLLGCKSIKAAIQNNLFPDSDSLWSLAIEFGVWREQYFTSN